MSILPFFANFYINLLNDFAENYQNLIFSCKLTTLFTPKWFLFLLRPDKKLLRFFARKVLILKLKRDGIFLAEKVNTGRGRGRETERQKLVKIFFRGNEIFLSFHFSY
jgi:hypothetical protein